LLARNLPIRPTAIQRPAQDKFLGALLTRLVEPQMDTPERQRRVESEADRLFPWLFRSPTLTRIGYQGRFDRVVGLFGSEFDLRQAFYVQPTLLGRQPITRILTDYPLSH